MPHCSLEFSRIGLPVAAHSQWNEEQTLCALRIFTGRQDANVFLATIPASERCGLAKCVGALQNDVSALGVWTAQGDIALSLTAFLVNLFQGVEEIAFGGPDVVGFWLPPAARPASGSMIMWSHPDDGCHVAIAGGKEQAEAIIRGLSWLEARRQKRLLRKIRGCRMSCGSSGAVRKVDGLIAEVLCKASLAAKINGAMNLQAKAQLN